MKTKTKQRELCNFSKDGFHHQPLALDENFSTWQSYCYHKWFIYFRFVLPTIMLAHCLYIDGVKSFPINKIIFVLAGCLNPHMGPDVDAANYTREPSLVVKPSLDYLQLGGRWPQNEFFLLLGQSKRHIFYQPWDRILGGRRCHRWVVESCRSQRNATLQEFVVSATAHSFSSSVTADRSAKSVSTLKLLVWKVVKKNFVLIHFFAYFWRLYWD